MSTRPLLTQREAAAACGVSRTTIRRRREAGELPGAVLDEERGWLIPVEDLLAAGFRLNAPSPPDKADRGEGQDRAGGRTAGVPEVEESDLRAELERLQREHEAELAAERHARALAEAEAKHLRDRLDERAEHIADLQRALKALTPAPERAAIPQPSPPATAPAAPVSAPPPAPAVPGDDEQQGPAAGRRRWWSRRA
jgi:hypothetical protein